MERARLDGTGLDWIGQGRVGLDADWTWLDWMEHDRVGGDKAVSYGIIGQVVAWLDRTITK